MSGGSKSGLFLLELILVIGLFALSGAVCLQMFAYASVTAQNAENLTQATLVARSGAACYQATQGDEEDMADILSGIVTEEGLVVYYDQGWQPTQQEGTYAMTLTQVDNVATIVVCQEETEIYTLEIQIAKGGVF